MIVCIKGIHTDIDRQSTHLDALFDTDVLNNQNIIMILDLLIQSFDMSTMIQMESETNLGKNQLMVLRGLQ